MQSVRVVSFSIDQSLVLKRSDLELSCDWSKNDKILRNGRHLVAKVLGYFYYIYCVESKTVSRIRARNHWNFCDFPKSSETGCFWEPHPTFGDFELKFLRIRKLPVSDVMHWFKNINFKRSTRSFWFCQDHFVEISWNQKKKGTKLKRNWWFWYSDLKIGK